MNFQKIVLWGVVSCCIVAFAIPPRMASAKKVARGGWAVWAYKSNPKPPYHPRGWHPCYIKYVASKYPNPKMSTRNGYVRVRYANTKKNASHFVSLFSMHHDDKSDGVVKFHSCRKAKFCTKYANTAVSQNKQNLRRKCGGHGRRWQNNFKNHYKWCLNVSTRDANGETRGRNERLKSCR